MLLFCIWGQIACSSKNTSSPSQPQATPSPIQNSTVLHERAKAQGSIQLTSTSDFPAEYREIAAALAKEQSNANEYYVDIKTRRLNQDDGYGYVIKDLGIKEGANVVELNCWYISAFTDENRNLNGNPGGRCFTVYYDKKQKKFSTRVSWQ